MKKPVKTFLKIGGIIVLLATVTLLILRYSTKAHSPEGTVSYTEKDLRMEIFYNRPYKKERVIFGNLVPYNEVWRTGANEATTFETNKDIMVDGSLLKAGKYTLWTIPMENSWKVIFNDKMYPWGINLEEKAYRNPEFDALILEVNSQHLKKTLEKFTISFKEENEFIFLNLAWDQTLVSVPIKPEKA
ncbi:Protein of unknown function [Salegentibacter holothuriorum]|uniref:DUF2911 domain-containing protein n=1 Tax=Salegentibacter holothuriorum TaxID=241145 RepID=A0A1T5D3P1_9FLAO|nr:DUF2911 domain-containing protein [Salegentibacter holothuriorum]SKB66314.1 Protein of unknown function [Salegentibacter holothuriorum]